MRISVVTPIPTPYRDPFWSHLASAQPVELQVLYCSAGKADRPWTADWQRPANGKVLRGVNLSRWGSASNSIYFNRDVTAELKQFSPDAVLIGGYNHPTMLAALGAGRAMKAPCVLMSETHGRRPRRALRSRLRTLLLRTILPKFAGGLPTGQLATEFLVQNGMPQQVLGRLPNVPDVVALRSQSQTLRAERSALRKQLGLEREFTYLFAGRLIAQKRPDLLLESFRRLPHVEQCDLVLVGSGPLESSLRDRAAEYNLTNVHLPGFVAPHELPRWYAAADCFVLPSSETWGVVALEAVACGTPLVLSSEVGCGPDVLTSPSLGRFARAGDGDALLDALQSMFEARISSDDVYRNSTEHVQQFSYANLGESLIRFLRSLGAR